ncbi:MAG TPA: hypothetical protein PKM63_10240 [Panacibacter sp.]|nr:hypothetical protein [Panacibacter sp.]HNP44655.1 hypothetical protein [Panacibacter sp.]
MKLFSFLFLLCISLHTKSQTSVGVTMNGIGNLKIGMKLVDVEKLAGAPLKLNNILKDDWNFDTIATRINGINFKLVFSRDYADEKKYDVTLREVSSSDSSLKTKSGITIGDDKLKIINTYEGYTIWIVPDYENDYTVRSKTRTTIFLFGDNSGNTILFHLFMNKIESMSVSISEGYD